MFWRVGLARVMTRFLDGVGQSTSGLRAKRLLASLDEEPGIFDWRVLKDAVAEIQDVARAAEGCDGFLRDAANLFGRAEEDGGVDVALDGDAWAELCTESAKVDAPVDAEDIGAGAGNCREQVMRGLRVVDDGSGAAEAGDDFLCGGECECFVVAQREFAAPGVEELDGGGAGGDLSF